MAKATIVFEDDSEGGVETSVTFDPPLKNENGFTGSLAQNMANQAIALLVEHTRCDEGDGE